MLHIKISSPECVLFDYDADKISLPTDQGAVTILPNHIPLVSPIKPWLVTIWASSLPREKKTFDFITQNDQITISVSKGMVFVDGRHVTIVTSVATSSPAESEQELSNMKINLQQKIFKLRQEGSIEEVERSLINLKKIEADLALSKMRK